MNSRKSEDSVQVSTSTEMRISMPLNYEAGAYGINEPDREIGEFAQIWRIYIDEASKFDSSLMEGCNRVIDVLLVFTGLFSAVLTTFIIQSCETLLSHSQDVTDTLLQQLVRMQANLTGTELPTVSTVTSTSPQQTRWVNGLWFSALSFSLSTALISMIAKQWLQAYSQRISGLPRQWAHQRQSRYMHFKAWRVLTLINSLPLLLHIALLLFFAGLLILLSSADVAIAVTTGSIVGCAYMFFITSMCLSLQYPDCPYKIPIYMHLRRWIVSSSVDWFGRSGGTPGPGIIEGSQHKSYTDQLATGIVNPEDELDASCLVWLITRSMDKYVVSTALQAIAGIPHDFSAIHILRDAGALTYVERGFRSCFEEETTIGVKWHLSQPIQAAAYCRAWMNLTRGTSEQWPPELSDPLLQLCELENLPDVAAIASCAMALSSLDTHWSQWSLLRYLAKYVAGEVHINHSTVCCLLNTIAECQLKQESSAAIVEMTSAKAVPTILQLLHRISDLPLFQIRKAATLALHSFTFPVIYQSEDYRGLYYNNYPEFLPMALSVVTTNPTRFGVEDSLVDTTIQDLAMLIPQMIAQSECFSSTVRDAVSVNLSKLFIAGRIHVGSVPDAILVDILHLFCRTKIPPSEHSLFVKTITSSLGGKSNLDITSNLVRLLYSFIEHSSLDVIQAFTENNGINIIVHYAKNGGIDNRLLQLDCWRVLCTFIDRLTLLCLQRQTLSSVLEHQLDLVFQSNLLGVIFSVPKLSLWWLFEMHGHLITATTRLCRLRPKEPIWRVSVDTLRDFTTGESDCASCVDATIYQIEAILSASDNSNGQSGVING